MSGLNHLMDNLDSSELHTVIKMRDQDCPHCHSKADGKQVYACTICSVVFCNLCPDIKITDTTITCPDGHRMPLK